MLLDYIERLRQKPRAARKQIAFFSALVVTGIIAIGWGVTLPGQLSGLANMASVNMEDMEGLGEIPVLSEEVGDLQRTIDMGELGYKEEVPVMLDASTSPASVDTEPQPTTTEVWKPKPVIIATSSGQTR